MTQDETIDYNSPHHTLILIETDIPAFTFMNNGALGNTVGLFQIKNALETFEAFQKANDKYPVVLAKPTINFWRNEIHVSTFYFLSGKIKLLLETTFYEN